jgi:4-methylaminobutanoate oxidase (formaldehyde-forming)
MVMLTLKDSQPGSPLLLHDEPIYCEGKIVGRTTSGNYSFNYKKNMSLGYINLVSSIKELTKKTFFIEVAKKKYEAILQSQALHDPENKIIKS